MNSETTTPTRTPPTIESLAAAATAERPRLRKSVDAEALLRSLAPVVAKPDAPRPTPEPAVDLPKPRPANIAPPPKGRPPAKRVEAEPEDEADDFEEDAPAPVVAKPNKPKSRREPEPDEDETPAPRKGGKADPAGSRATLDVAINPGEGTTAIYVRVPRTTHMALKLLALQNQALMDGPTELASLVRTAIDEYLAKQRKRVLAA